MRSLTVLCFVVFLSFPASAGPLRVREKPPWANGRLAFVESLRSAEGYYRLVVSDPTGARPRVISGPQGGVQEPAWSPDGTSIALVDFRDTVALYVVHPDGSGLRRLTVGFSPTWAPDGSKLAFERGERIYLIDADGTDERVLTAGFEPSWSPDGVRIAFVSGSKPRGDLFTIGVDGSGLAQLTTGSRDGNPEWSPDGSRIVFERKPSSNEVLSIYVVRRNGTGVRRLTRIYGARPTWSPNGSKILFAGRGEILVMNPDGSALTNLTRTSRRFEFSPTLQPVRMRNGALSGTPFDDYLAGGSGPDVIRGHAGDDVISGGAGRDVLDGGAGGDTLRARDRQRDVIDGGPGQDRAFVDRRLDRVRGVERRR